MFFMQQIARKWLKFLCSTKWATAMEYGLIAAGIALGIVAALFLTSDVLESIFSDIAAKMDSARVRAGA